MYENLAIIAAFVFVYSCLGAGLERTPFSGALVFSAFGLAFGPLGLGLITLDVGAEGLRTLAEMTLALVLFIDAANANLGVLKEKIRLPRRLLLVGLPLTILLGYLVGVLVFDGLGVFEIALIAFLALATGSAAEDSTTMLALKLVAEEIGIGLAVGLGLTWFGSRLLEFCAARGWVSETWRQLPVVALAVVCFAVAQSVGGSGFIACFAGGMLFGWIAKENRHKLLVAAEGTGDTLALITWVIFGAAVIGQSSGVFSWDAVIYALLSVTVIRMLPVFLVLTGTGLRVDEKLFMGWFGPRGLASIVFGVIVLNESLPGGTTITMTAVFTILFSVIGHGLSANPLSSALAARIRKATENHGKG
jgi:NhaP-type Na+/H+ or K+/H+ antiporter